MSDVTRLVAAAQAGDRKAAADLFALMYDELRKLAAAKMAVEANCHTLDATALVHEAYLRLLGDQRFDGRGHFFAAAAEAMRRILIDRARQKNSEKRGRGRARADIEPDRIAAPERSEDLLALDEALNRLAAHDPRKAKLVELRYFAGLSLDQVAEILGISPATADRDWAYARAWLHHEISKNS
jgi:RNA polymerase sigma factor (TIGR02999 family)